MSVFGLWFDTPWALAGLLLLLPLVWGLVNRRRHGGVPLPSRSALAGVPLGLAGRLWWLPDGLRIAAVLALVLAVARPQTEDRQVLSGEGVDVMLALDMSISMNAVDLEETALEATLDQGVPPRNRFEIARDTLEDFVVSRHDDRIGLVIFGREAWLKYPLTLDYGRLVATLNELVLDGFQQDQATGQCLNGCTIAGTGTAIGDALGRAYNRLRRSASKSRIVVLITDGKQEGGTLDALAIARHIASLPSDEQVRIYTFLVGSQEQTWIPDIDLRGRPLVDLRGVPVYSRPRRPFPVDPDLLREIAGLTGGKFYESYNEEKFLADVEDLERTVFSSRVHVSRSDVFALVALIALLLLAAEWLLRFTRWRGLT